MWTPRNLNLDTLHIRAIDESWGVTANFRLPVIHSELLGLLWIEGQVVVSASHHQALDLLPVG